MPIITKISKSTETAATYESIANVFAQAVASAIGTEAKVSTDGLNYVDTSPMGYDGLCVVFEGRDHTLVCRILKTNADKTPIVNDENAVSFILVNVSISDSSYSSATCVMIYDENKDTVSFNVHPGASTHGEDAAQDCISFTFFFARDVNNDVLCGVGRLFPNSIRTLDSRSSLSTKTPELQKADDIQNTLHLTKMVNYLSPGCPEMKSAYVSVIRPFENLSDDKKFVRLYNIDGVNYGRSSYIDSWDSNKISDYNCYYPMDPFIKY